jgi:hypothetical protein
LGSGAVVLQPRHEKRAKRRRREDEHRTLNIEHRTSNTGPRLWTLDFGLWTLGLGLPQKSVAPMTLTARSFTAVTIYRESRASDNRESLKIKWVEKLTP